MTDLSPAYAALLPRVDLFSSLSRMALAQVAAHVDVIKLDDGESVFNQGDPPDAFYILARGKLAVLAASGDGQAEVRLSTLGPGDFFGEMALLTDEPRSATVRAEPGGAEVLRLERARFLDLVRREPAVAHQIAATLTRRLRMNAQVIVQGERAIASTVQQILSRLDSAMREQVLRASLLDTLSGPVLPALFQEHAAELSARLAEIGVDVEQPSGPVVKLLREIAGRDLGPDGVQEFALQAAGQLVKAHQWEAALGLLAHHGPRTRFIEALGEALRGPEPLAGDASAPWVDRVSDDEAVTDIDLALAKAALYEERDERTRALTLLRRALGAALQEHHPSGGARLGAEIARIAGEMGTQSVGALRFGLQPIKVAHVMRGPVQVLFGGAGAVMGTLAFTGPADPRWKFALLLGAAVALWMSELLPGSTVSLALMTSWILTGVATVDQAVSGFGSKDWVFVVALLGLAVAIARSGLLFRVGLLLIRRMPRGLLWQAGTLMLTGILLGPVLPMAIGRIALTEPLALGVAQSLRLKDHAPSAAVLGLSTWIGAGPLLFTFLNASPACLLAWALLPEATRRQFDWIHWFLAAAPLTILIAIGSLAAMFLVLRPTMSAVQSRAKIDLQLAVLGAPTVREVAMVIILVLLIVGWLFGPALHLDAATVAALGLIAAFLTGNLDRHSWRDVDWDYVIFFGILLAMGHLLTGLGIDRLAGETIGSALKGLGITPTLFVVLVGAVSIPVYAGAGEQAVLFLSLAFIPVASVLHVNPWLVSIAILSTLLVWLIPATTPEYMLAHTASEGRLFSHAQARKVAVAHALITIGSLSVATLYWRLIGLM